MDIREALRSAEAVFYYIKEHDWQEIAAEVSREFSIPVEELLATPMGGYRKDGTGGIYCFVLEDLCSHVDDYLWLYDRLPDAMSKYVLWKLLCYRLVPDIGYVASACERTHRQYYDPGIMACGKDEVFVDCGGFTGDSALAFIEEYKSYKRVYVFEPSECNRVQCEKNLKGFPGIEIVAAGVSKRSGWTEFSISGSSSSVMTKGKETEMVRLASLDESIPEPVSFIKMDIEGAELDALEGARSHIQHDRPKLAVCVYHLISDLWEIPRTIDMMMERCTFFLRHYQPDQPWETVLYAIPDECVVRQEEQADGDGKPNIYMFPAAPLQNVQILKDRIVIPYVFYRQFGKSMTIVTRKLEEYPYMGYLDGAAIDFLAYEDSEKNGYGDAYCHYLLCNYRKIDILFLFGAYIQYAQVAALYKMLRPDGKVYLKLDANSAWMDRLPVGHPQYTDLMASCDVISCESRKLQRLLAKKWPYKIDYIPNGFYDFFHAQRGRTPYLGKEDVILTVGRIGTEQKNHELLLEGFAMAEERIGKGWKVRLVGGVQKNFRDWLGRYFTRYPHMRDRVQLTGPISEKEELFREYRKAKVFALTSRWEGGSPNVYAEAASHGCSIVVTEIDASGDMTDGGRLGAVVPQEDAAALADAFVGICNDEDRMGRCCDDIQQYLYNMFDYDKIVNRLHLLLCLS